VSMRGVERWMGPVRPFGTSSLTHVDERSGAAKMVDVSGKAATRRRARASCRVELGPLAFEAVQKNSLKKGDVLTVAKIAGISASKQTAQLIPLCHPLPLSLCDVSLSLEPSSKSVLVSAEAVTTGPTGVEMEALTAAAVAGLTVYDMCKAVSKGITISSLRLEEKEGGKSGSWMREEFH